MKIAIALIGIALAAVLVVSATMGAETLVPGGDSKPSKVPGGEIKTNGKARLMPTNFAPPTLKGTSFKPGENVTIRLEGLKTKRVQASSAGSFTVRFPSRVDRCNGMTATAVGDQGSRAAFQLAEFQCAMSGTQQ
jgi:hypothetical protein